MQILLSLFLAFLQIGSVSFGGGYAMLPYIETMIIENHGWLTNSEFLDILAISQVTPGPIAINPATFIGFRYLGFWGAVSATLGIVCGPFIFMSIVTRFIEKYKSSDISEHIFTFLRPITSALILSAAYSTLLKSVIDLKSFIIFSASLMLLLFTKLHPIVILMFFGFLGLFI